MVHQVIDHLLFDLGLAPYVRRVLPDLSFIDVVALWVAKVSTLLLYPFYWVLGCNMDEIHTLVTQTEVPLPSRQQTIRIVDNYCKSNDVIMFMFLSILVCGTLSVVVERKLRHDDSQEDTQSLSAEQKIP